MTEYIISRKALLDAIYENPESGGNERAIQLLEAIMKAPEITNEKFEAEAKRRGYYLQKKSENVKFLPCTCGLNNRAEWRDMKAHGWFFKCNRCGLTSPVGKTHKEAKLNWNKMIEEKMKDAVD